MLQRLALVLALVASVTRAHDPAAPPPASAQPMPHSFVFKTGPPEPTTPPPLDFQFLTRDDTHEDATDRLTKNDDLLIPSDSGSSDVEKSAHLRSVSDPAPASETPSNNEPEVAGEYVRWPSTRARMRVTF